ncbi:putative RNA-directed DNA polymerase [Helianthus annuus]|nr:putative RNA-directed DNA polymerase [Helianthus annuus]
MGDTSTSATMISKLDIGDPLYLHPSDSSTLTIVSIKLKGTENYPVWSNAMRLALEAKNKYGFIDGKCIKPKDDQVLANQWDRCNSVVITWLLNSISEELFLGQVFSKLASEVWTDLKESFDKVDGSVVYDLYKRINGISQNGSTVAEYYNRLTTMWKQFDAMVQLPSCSCQAAKDYNDFTTLIKLMQFLMGLDDVYQPVRTNLLTREPFPSVKVAFSIVSREESHRLSSNGSKGQNVSFVTKSGQSFDFRRKNTRGPNPSLKCSHCNMLGHTVDRCYEIIGYPPGFRKRSGGQVPRSNVSNNSNKNNTTVGSSNSVGTAMPFTSEQISKLLSLVGENSGGEQAKSNMGDVFYVPGYSDLRSKKVLVTGNQDNGLYFVGKHGNSANMCFNSVFKSNLWHSRLGHPSDQVLAVLKGCLDIKTLDHDPCEICHKAKQVRVPFPLSDHKTKEIGDLVHLDVWGPYRVSSNEGFKYFLTVVDDYSRSVWCYLLKSKMEVFENITDFYELLLTQFKKRVKIFRSDNGTEFVNHQMSNFLKGKGILHQTTCAYTPQQNGVVERKHRHLLNIARALMFQCGLPLGFWSDCILTAVYLINRLPSSVLLGKSPYEIVFGFKPSLIHLRNFGCLCFSTVLNESDKFTYHADKCVLIGYSNVKKGYKLWSLDNKKVLFSRDVKFYENIYPFKSKHVVNQEFVDKTLNHITFFDCYDTETPEVSQIPDDEEGNNGSHGISSDDQQPLGPSTSTITSVADQTQQATGCEGSSEPGLYGEAEDSGIPSDETNLSEGAGLSFRRSTRTSVAPKKFEDYVLGGKVKYGIDKTVNYACLSSENFSFVSLLNKTIKPSSYNEAAKDPRWVEAMNKEMEALFRNNTWTLVDLPHGRKPIGCKWVYKVKYKSSGEIERFKARLVAKGFNQREGLDFGETFSPVVKMVTVRCVIALAVQNDWPLFQLDINNAFLYGTINEDVYMCLPQGYYSSDETRVCKLVKSLYGLKQAPRKWNERLNGVLVDYGFVQSKCDHSMYVLAKNEVFVVLLVYVDDIVVTGNSIDEVDKVKAILNLNFQIKDLGKLKYFLGIEVLYNKSGVCLNQRKYCLELLSEFGYLACKPINTPIEQSYLITAKVSKNQSFLKNVTGFQKLIGKLIYLSLTRPDISYAVQFLSQFMHNPTEMHLQIALRLLRYLKSGPGCGLLFKKSDRLDLVGYVDSDWAKCLSTRKSVTGYCVYLGSSLVSWKSKKQSTVSRSTGEAEYRAMCSATCEIMWLLNLLREVGVNCGLPVKLYCDSKAAISIAANPVFHEKTKHFEVDLHFLREKVGSGVIETVKVDSESQPADGFTKGLSIVQHKRFCEKLGLVNWFSYLNEEGMLKE